MATIITTGKKKAPLKKSVIDKAARRAKIIKAISHISDMNVEFISILTDGEKPANGCPVLIKSVNGNKEKRELQLHLVSKSVKEGLLFCTSMEPGKVDKQGDVASAEEVKKMSHSLIEKSIGIDINHNLKKTDTKMVENFILRVPDPENFKDIAVGSACHVFKLGSDMLAKAETITGVSVYGDTLRKDVTEGETDAPSDGEVLRQMRVKAGIGDIDVAEALGLSHEDYTAVESDQKDIQWTGDAFVKLGKLFKMPPTDIAAAMLNGEQNENEDANGNPPGDGSGDAPPDPTAKPNDPTTLGKSQTMDKGKIKREKVLLKSGTLRVADGAGEEDTTTTSLSKSDKPSAEAMNALRKSILGFTPDARERLKKGDIVSTDFAPGGSLAPEVGRTLLSLVRDQSAILKKINLHEVHRRDAEVLVTNFRGRLSRQAVGPHGSGAAEGVLNSSIKVSTQEIDLLVRIPNRTIDEYRTDLPGLEQLILGMVEEGFANKLTKLCFMGKNRTYAPVDDSASDSAKDTAEMTLGQGFFDIALNGSGIANGSLAWPGAQIVDISDSGLDPANPLEILDAMRAAFVATLPEFDDNSIPFLMGPTDFFAFEQEIKQNLMGLQLQINGVEPKWGAHPIEQVNYIPTQNYLLTPLANLGLAILNSATTDGGIKVQVTPIRKGVEWLFTMQVDPFIASTIGILAKA